MAIAPPRPRPPRAGGLAPRIDGAQKVSGTARYTSDYNLPGMLYAVPVCATIARGKIASLDCSRAEAMPGVKAVYRRENIGPIFRCPPSEGFSLMIDERRPPFEDDVIRYYGQYVAAIVALTFEQAVAAAHAVEVTYTTEAHDVSEHLARDLEPSVDSERGDPESAFASAPVTLDETYATPVETHNPIESHATVAHWDGTNYTLYETTQAVSNHRDVMAQMLGVPTEHVRVISRFLGSGFGGKLWPWPHCLIAASAARNLNRPVKLVLTRDMMFTNVGHRPRTQQRIRIGASAEGKLVAVMHDALNHTSILDEYNENCTEATPYLYSTPNLRVTNGLVRRNVGSPTAMRGPGAVPGLFALEAAIDELAEKLGVDPVELRIKNEPEQDESLDLPFSSRHYVECLRTGAEKFGWQARDPKTGSMRKDGLTLGWGVAGCSWIAERQESTARVEFRRDGTVRVACGTQDIGTGTYTVLAEVAAGKTGIARDRIEVVLGDTSLPTGPISGGSWATASVIPAVFAAIGKAQKTILNAAAKTPSSPFSGNEADDLAMNGGRVHLREKDAASGVPFEEVLVAANMQAAAGEGKAEGTLGAPGKKFSTHSFGAQFVEVTWQPETAQLRVSRVVTVIDAGRIINPKPARNQIEGAIVMGVGMALLEETNYDPRFGNPVNTNMADYLMATNADTPEIDVTFLDYPDTVLNELGARGVGEIGLAGIAAAITSAIFHATGIRIRELPVHIEELLAANAVTAG